MSAHTSNAAVLNNITRLLPAMEITLHHKDQPDVLDSVSSITGSIGSYVWLQSIRVH